MNIYTRRAEEANQIFELLQRYALNYKWTCTFGLYKIEVTLDLTYETKDRIEEFFSKIFKKRDEKT